MLLGAFFLIGAAAPGFLGDEPETTQLSNEVSEQSEIRNAPMHEAPTVRSWSCLPS